MRNKSTITLVVLGSALLSLSAAAAAPVLKFTFKNITAPKAVETDTYAINSKGVIAGDWADSTGTQHGLILAGKKATSVDEKDCGAAAGSTAIAFYGINTAGTAVGWCTLTSSGEPVGLMYSKGKLTEFSVPKALATEGIGINDKGEVVGMFVDSAGAQHGFLLNNKKYTQIDVPKDSSTEAWDINNAGQITVYALNTANTYDSFVLTGKTFKKVSVPGASSPGTIVHALNNKGDVDGTFYDSTGATHGFLLHGGKYYTLTDPAGADTRADGLNDTLEIVGRWGAGTYGGTGYEATTKP
jgi:probable HAF family extracellular repeat protein